jgi:HAMP domain-containing protein
LDPTIPWLLNYAAPLLLAVAVLLVALLGIVIWLAIRLQRAEIAYRTLTAGTNAGNLQAILEDHILQVHQATERVGELDELTHQME